MIGSTMHDHSSWMSAIPNYKSLADLSIPGTHDTATYNVSFWQKVISWIQCQDQALPEQLSRGIRCLDMRCRRDNNKLVMVHGPSDLGIDFRSMIDVCIDFLKAHPGETIIMYVKEEGTATNTTLSFEKILNDYIKSAPFYTGNTVPTLGTVRGKIVLMRRFPGSIGIDQTNWPDNSTFDVSVGGTAFHVQDEYDISNFFGVLHKWKAIENCLAAASSGIGGGKKWYVNFTSAVAIPTIAPRSMALDADIYGMNGNLSRYLRKNKGVPVGTVMMDFPFSHGDVIVHEIISRNLSLDYTLSSAPVVPGDGNIYFQTSGNKLTKISMSDGSANLNSIECFSQPVLFNDTIYFIGIENKIHRLKADGTSSAQNLKQISKCQPVVAAPVANGTPCIFFRGEDNKLLKMNLDGSGCVHVGQMYCASQPVVPGDGFVYYQGTDNKLWKTPVTSTVTTESINLKGHVTKAQPTVSDSAVYFQGTDDKLWMVDKNGTKTSNLADMQCSTPPVAPGDGNLYFQGTKNQLWRMKTNGTDVVNLGNHTTKGRPVVFVDSSVFVQDANDRIMRINHDGSRSEDYGVLAMMPPVVVPNDRYIYCVDLQKRLLRIPM